VSADGGTVLYSGKVGMNEVVETDRVLDVVAVDVVIGIDVDVDNIDVVAVGRNVDVNIEVVVAATCLHVLLASEQDDREVELALI
jgi:hypothetical protein